MSIYTKDWFQRMLQKNPREALGFLPCYYEDRGIKCDPRVMGGDACIEGTRLPIRMFRGYDWQEFKREWPELSDEQVINALRYWDVRGVKRDWPGKDTSHFPTTNEGAKHEAV